MADNRPIGFWLKLVDRLIDEQFAATLEEHGVTRRQWQLLNVLAQSPSTVEQLDTAVAPFLAGAALGAGAVDGGSVGETTLGATAESSVEHLGELIDSGWVDATATGYELTERGEAALERLGLVVAEQRTLSTRGVAEDDYLTTVSVLERVARNLGFAD